MALLVNIEKIVDGGYGLARSDNGVCLIPFAVPGDILDVECSEGTNPSFCWIKKIERASEYRIESICPNFGVCGGCDFQNIDYKYELEIKKNILKENLKRISKIEIDKINLLNSYPDYYRNNVQFKTDDNGNIGFFRKKSNEVIPIPLNKNGCLIIDKKINSFVETIYYKVSFKKGGFRVRSNREGNIYKKGIPGLGNNKYCYYRVLGMDYRIGIDDFFQVNNYLYEKWLKLIIDYIEPEKNDNIADFFSGSGFITLPIAKRVNKVFGMEVNGSAVKNAKYNSILNKVDNSVFKRVDVNRGFFIKEKLTKIIIDPPRSGISRLLIDELIKCNPDVVVYVSCNTATFARDIAIFYQKGFYIDKITMVDLFPRTAHVEVVSRLMRI